MRGVRQLDTSCVEVRAWPTRDGKQIASRVEPDMACRFSSSLPVGATPPWSPVSEGGQGGPPLQAKIFVWFAGFVIKNNFGERFSLYCGGLRNLSLIQLIDIAAIVEFFNEAKIDKVFGLRSLCFRVAR